MSALSIVVIGGGLAGTEAAYQIARRGLPVQLYEMRPQRQTPAHQTALLGELVCSNSLKADTLSSAHGLLKAELRQFGSLVRQEVVSLPEDQLTVVATGPLTSPALIAHLQARLGDQHLYFYDALSPIVAADSIDESKTFLASRYD